MKLFNFAPKAKRCYLKCRHPPRDTDGTMSTTPEISKTVTMPSQEAARYIGMSEAWMRKGRMHRSTDAPPYMQIGKSIRYLRADLDRWLESRRVVHGDIDARAVTEQQQLQEPGAARAF